MSTAAFITGDVLRWARERADLTAEAVAAKLKVKVGTLEAWEREERHPTFRQAEDLANRLHVPLGYLFLSNRPEERFELPDLRTVGDSPPTEPSPDLIEVVEDAIRKQDWYREYRLEEGADALPFVGRFSLDSDHREVATDIRTTIGMTPQLRREASGWEDFQRTLVQRIELAGILVLRRGVVGSDNGRRLDVEEFRGFALSDAIAPLIFLNASDYPTAQNFTLGHELAHIWIAQSGLSNPDYARPAADQENEVERFSNRVSAEILVPESDLAERWNAGEMVDANVRTHASYYRVSQIALLIQARDSGLVTGDEFATEYERQKAGWAGRRNSSTPGGNFYNTLFSRNSATLATAMISSVVEGRMGHREAAHLLNIKPRTLSGVAERLLGVSLDG